MALSPKQRRFVDEYLIDLNATQAAIRAGYSGKTARQIAQQNLSKLDIQSEISKRISEREKRTEITQDMVLQELARIGFANMQDYMKISPDGDPALDFSQLTRDQAAALVEVTVDSVGSSGEGEDLLAIKRVKFKLGDKRAALVDIGRHLGMFKDKVELTGKDGGPVKSVNLSPEEFARIAREVIDEY